EQLRHHAAHVGALRDQMPVPAVRGGDDVVGVQRRADPDGHRLLANVLVRDAGDLVRVHEVDHPLLEAADRAHRSVELGHSAKVSIACAIRATPWTRTSGSTANEMRTSPWPPGPKTSPGATATWSLSRRRRVKSHDVIPAAATSTSM